MATGEFESLGFDAGVEFPPHNVREHDRKAAICAVGATIMLVRPAIRGSRADNAARISGASRFPGSDTDAAAVARRPTAP